MNKEKGLVLEGGSLRGMFSCGIIDVFLENGIEFDGMVGVSAGAAFGCNYKSKQIGRAYRYNLKYCGDKRYASIESWLKTGNLFNVDFCYRELVKTLDPFDNVRFKNNPMEFYCVATDIENGRAEYFKCVYGDDKDMLYLRSSASIPVFSKPVEIDKNYYLDGGVSDSIPLKFMEDIGYKKIVVVETQPKEYLKQPQKHILLVQMFLHKYPKLVELLKNRYLMYNEEKKYVREKEEKGEALVLRPSKPLEISSFNKDPNKIKEIYLLGRECGLKNLHKIKDYLGA